MNVRFICLLPQLLQIREPDRRVLPRMPLPRLKPDTQRARRSHILDAAQQCFARSGFHRTTMQDICKAAEVSPGALYLYFDSKEALIEGICERDRAEFAERIQTVAAAPDFLAALRTLAEQYFIEEPAHKRLMAIEIGIESTRNPRVGTLYCSVDGFVRESFRTLFQRLKDDGRIDPVVSIDAVVEIFSTLGDGLFWRRAIDPHFDPERTIPVVLHVLGDLLRPVEPGTTAGTAPTPALSANETEPCE
jgi:TetR/AcrR family transcriptional repressor of uid operon